MVEMKKLSSQLTNEKGQAVFELVLFIPFLLFLYTIYYTAGNAINSSIVQQKAVRGYFYVTIKNNSYINSVSELNTLKEKGIKRIGFNALGWTDHMGTGGTETYGTCFKFSSILNSGSEELCDSPDRQEQGTSRIIRIFTYYGVCGPTYTIDNRGDRLIVNPSLQAYGKTACELSNND
jgi:hypothetical protein